MFKKMFSMFKEESNSDNNEGDQSLMGSKSELVEICPDCHGSGSLADNTCSSCNGKGVIWKMISVHKDLKRVIDVWYDLEKKNWENSGMDNKHIFISLHNIKEFLERDKDD